MLIDTDNLDYDSLRKLGVREDKLMELLEDAEHYTPPKTDGYMPVAKSI